MSSQPQTSVPVAPREIVDLVDRWARLDGLDPGTSMLLAKAVTDAAVAGGRSVALLLDQGPAERWAALTGDDARSAQPATSAQWAHAHRHGIALSLGVLRELESKAAGFLVAERVLDDIHPDE